MDKEQRVFLETRLRNLKRKYSRVIQHADQTETAIGLKADIDHIERQLKLNEFPICDDMDFVPIR